MGNSYQLLIRDQLSQENDSKVGKETKLSKIEWDNNYLTKILTR